MSWQDRLENTVFTIVTGDGQVYTPLWKNGETSKDFNAVIYDFINVAGSLIDRRQVRARSFPLTFWFTGADNIDQAEAFDQSSNDNRAWTVTHPFYGQITGQPLAIRRIDTAYNATEFNVDFWETITDKLPVSNISISDVMEGTVKDLATLSPLNYAGKVKLKPADVNTVRDNITQLNLKIKNLLSADNYSAYTIIKNKLFGDADNLISVPVTVMQGIHEMIQLPALFVVSVTARLNLLAQLYQDAKAVPMTIADGLLDITSLLGIRNNKAYFESVGGAVIVAMCNAMVNPLDGDYTTRKQIEAAAAVLGATYEDYLATTDANYVALTDPESSFAASQETQAIVSSAVISTISSLNGLAFNARQERVTLLQRDSNLITVTHQYLGLDADDANIEQFRQINKIKNKELFLLKKGRRIIYYV